MDSPCKNCERRKLLCHSVCEVYKAYTAEVEVARQKRIEINDVHPSWKRNMKRNGRK